MEMKKLFDKIKKVDGVSAQLICNGEVIDTVYLRIPQDLLKCGVESHRCGYDYLVSAINKCLVDRSMMEGVTKVLYPTIAKEFQVSAQSVEHGIRNAIYKAWVVDKGERMKEYFYNSKVLEQKKPSNSVFICAMVYYLENHI